METAEIAVVGAGAVGASVAYALATAGHDVLVLDRGAVGQGATAGTACLVTASHAERMASPQALLEGLRALPNPAGPLSIRPSPGALRWLARFTGASLRPAAARGGTGLLVDLAVESIGVHRAWHRALDTGLVERGLVNAYLTEAGFARAHALADELRPHGVPSRSLDRAALAALEPAVQGAVGGILFEGDAHVDSLAFARRVAAGATAAGARVLEGVDVHRLQAATGGVRLDTGRGEVRADRVVLAAGVDSPAFARDLGLPLPIAGAKGYHVEHAAAEPILQRPVFLAETRVVATPLDGRLRLAGTLELGTAPRAVDMRRVDAIAAAGARHVAGLEGAPRTAVWAGLRPMTADGMPIIGPAPHTDRVLLATGHGMLGVVLGPVTGVLVARLVAGEPLEPRLAALRPNRFRSLPTPRGRRR